MICPDFMAECYKPHFTWLQVKLGERAVKVWLTPTEVSWHLCCDPDVQFLFVKADNRKQSNYDA